MRVCVGLCLSLLRCACPCWAVPVFVMLCLSVLGCACLCYAVRFRVGLCLSLLRCAYLSYAVRVCVGLCLSFLRCAIVWNTLVPQLNDDIDNVKKYAIMARWSKTLLDLDFDCISPQTLTRREEDFKYN